MKNIMLNEEYIEDFQNFTSTDKIYESTGTAVYRGIRDNVPVILKVFKKEYPSSEELARYRQEYDITKDIQLKGVIKPQGIKRYKNTLVIIFEDFGGRSLKYLFKERSFSIEEILHISINICTIIGELHSKNIIHKDINPSNIILNPDTGDIKIIDFEFATRLDERQTDIINPGLMEGTLPYISPEQTGRINRNIDYRTDFYSFGITMYELLTGMLPFDTGDELKTLHAHIAIIPVPPSELNREIPEELSHVIMKLLSKSPEDRYQSAGGIKADLEDCLLQIKSKERNKDFSPGKKDIPDRLNISRKLYGREEERNLLFYTFDTVCKGNKEIMVISGYSGTGKSYLVYELQKCLTGSGGYFITGKFEPFDVNIPYSGPVKAFKKLTGHILGESEAKLLEWKEKILSVLGSKANLIIQVIPELELITGPQPPVTELPPGEMQNLFNLLFINFIELFCQKEHPLIMFLDDLQWADSGSLNLMELIMAETKIKYLFLIYTCRDNEVTSDHPAMVTMDKIKKEGISIHEIKLKPLKIGDITDLLHDSFYREKQSCRELAELIMEKTAGNPFFIDTFLKSLYSEKCLNFNYEKSIWQWDLNQIGEMNITDNVAGLLLHKIKGFSDELQETLKIASCIGYYFDIATLAFLSEKSSEETAEILKELIIEGFIIPATDRYITGEYKFCHDRIFNTVFSTVSEEKKAYFHLKTGTYMLQSRIKEHDIFNIINHINLGLTLLGDEKERYEYAKLNLLAGKKARTSAAYEQSLNYFLTAIDLIGEEAWKSSYELALDLYSDGAESAYLCNDFNKMEELVKSVLNHGRTVVDKIKVYETKIQSYIAQNKLLEAVETGLHVLKMLGVNFPIKPGKINILSGFIKTELMLWGKKIEDLFNIPDMTDSKKLAILRIMSTIGSPVYISVPELLPILIFTAINLSIKYGISPETPLIYAAYGLILCDIKGDIEHGYKFGKLALKLMDRVGIRGNKAEAIYMVTTFIEYWHEPLRNTLKSYMEGYESGMERGNLEFAAVCLHTYCMYSMISGKELQTVEKEMVKYTGIIKQLKQTNSLHYLEIYHQSLANLLEYSEKPGMLQGDIFNEEKMIPLHKEARDIAALFHLYFNKLILNYLSGNYREALENGTTAEGYLEGTRGSILVAQFYFYYSLAGLSAYNSISEKERKIILKKIRGNQKKLKSRACHCPANFLHEYYLLEAELHRISDHNPGDYYDMAVQYAGQSEFIHEEAIANELAGKFYLTKGDREKSTVYLKNARYCYERWGAVIKVRELDEKYRDILVKKIYSEKSSYPTNQFGSSSREGLDLISVMKAIGALSGEIILGNLLRRLMDIVMENAGAEKAFLILKEGEKLIIEAKVSADKISLFEPALLEYSKEVSLSIVYYVARTSKDIVLDNAFTSDIFNRDEYIREKKPKSILCTGLIKSGILTGILYLENNHTEGAFTDGHMEILKMISSQAAISIENAKLYSRIEESEKKYRSIFENATEGIFQLLSDRSFLTVNPAMAKIFGYSSPEEFLADISCTEKLYVDPGQKEEISRKLKETGIIRDYQARGYRKDRHIIYVSINAHEVRDKDNNLLYYEGIIEDITQKKQAEDLKIAKETAEADLIRLATAIEQAGESVFITDRKGIIEYVNPAFEHITGYERDEIKGKKPGILKSGKHDRLFYENIWNTITSGNIWTGHFINRRKDGSLYELDASITPVRDSNGNITNYVSVRRDVTDKLRLERQLRQSQKMEAIGTLSGGIAHDFNNILAAIIGNTEMALNKIADKSPGRDNLERIMKSCYRAKDLITQILSFSRQKEQESKPVNIASVIKEAIKLLRASLPSTIKILENIKEDTGKVIADPTQIHQILMNLCTNSAHSMRGKNGLMEISLTCADEPEPDLKPGDYVKLSVRDNGHGIPREIIERIFDPYFTTKKQGEGTGLGLSIVHGIVKNYGGTITVSSEPGKGTIFNIFLPEIKVKTPDETEGPVIQKGHGETILFIDDEKDLTIITGELLKLSGYEVITETDSLKALKIFKCEPQKIDLVITDQTMPQMTGSQLATELLNIRPDIPIILCTGFSEVIDSKKAKDIGIKEFVKKPFDMKIILKAIRKALK